MKSKGAPPTIDLEPIFAKLDSNPALAEKARRLATLLGDTTRQPHPHREDQRREGEPRRPAQRHSGRARNKG